MTMRTALVASLVLLLTACRDEEPRPRTSVVTRPETSRTACITALLATRAVDNLTALGEVFPADAGESDPGAGVTGQAARAAREYARAYHQFATLRASAAAYADSAAIHARTPADSARYAQSAAGFAVRSPEPGTVEANVADAHARDFAVVWNDADHPCNWDVGQ